MLKKRVITACIMMLAFLCVLFFSSWSVFVSIISIVFVVGLWEWSDLSGLSNVYLRVAYVAAAVVMAVLLGMWSEWARDVLSLRAVLVVACTWWALAFLWVQSFPASAVLWRPQFMRVLMGLLVILPAWLSVIFLRGSDNGVLLVLMCLLIVAAADVGAYFSGKKFGRHKLAPQVSPGKSLEGALGGMVFALFIGLSFGFFILGYTNWLVLILVIMPTALISVVGDLVESMVKRIRGIKDSGKILPGHGGILDRIDGMVAALPVFSIALLAANWPL